MRTVFGRSLRAFREHEGFTQAELAEATGITRSVIANWESGRRMSASVVELQCLARVLNVHPAALDPDYDPERAERITEALREVGRAMRALDEAYGRKVG